MTIRSGMKDDFNSLLSIRQPGALTEIANIEVEEYYPLATPITVIGKMFNNGVSRLWAERLKIIDESKYTQAVAHFGKHNGWLDDQIAISYNPYGRGGVYYVGVHLDEIAQTRMLDYICDLNGIKPILTTPSGVEVCQRVTPDGQKVFIVINHQASEKKVLIPWAARDHISGFSGKGFLALEPYGVVILTREE